MKVVLMGEVEKEGKGWGLTVMEEEGGTIVGGKGCENEGGRTGR